MKRLTYKHEGKWCIKATGTLTSNVYGDTWGEPVDRLAHYEDMEEQGRLVVLPCKVGDTVYWLGYNRDACDDCKCYSSFYGMDSMCDMRYELYPCIDPVDDKEHCPKHFVEIVEWKTTLSWIVDHMGEFGKTVFLTCEDAERALAEKMYKSVQDAIDQNNRKSMDKIAAFIEPCGGADHT